MNRESSIWKEVSSALVVAIGMMIVLALLFGWSISLGGGFLVSNKNVNESINISIDGTPVITSSAADIEIGRRTTDGKPWPSDYEKWIYPAYFREVSLPGGIVDLDVPWNARFLGASDGKKPPTAWYLIRNAEPAGRVYLAGFDAGTKLPVGFIGRDGFRSSRPSAENRFVLPQDTRIIHSTAVSTQYLNSYNILRQWDHRFHSEGKISPWLIYLIHYDELMEINLREKTVRTALEVPNILAVSQVHEPATPSQDDDSPANLEEQKTVVRFAVRAKDLLVIYDPPTEERREFVLPEEFRHGRLSVFSPNPDELLLSIGAGHWEGGFVTRLVWINREGQITRDERIELAARIPPSEQELSWMFAGAVPVPIAWAGRLLGYDPLRRIQNHQSPDYTSALQYSLGIHWPALSAVAIASLLFSILALRHHHKLYFSHTEVWTLFVFLLGLPGLIAYWLQHRRPPMAACDDCGRQVPRNRPDCAACGTNFPPPALLGSELFDAA